METENKVVVYEDHKIFTDGYVAVDDVSVTYTQNGDCTEDEDNVQTITISSRNNGLSRFINIKTEGWSIDGPEEMVNILKDFCKRSGIVPGKEDN